MPAEINKVKVLGELFDILVKINDMKNAPNYRRLSPATKEVIAMLDTSIRACQEAVRSGHPLMFEINVWEQLSLTGWAINLADGEIERE
jgi:hypothetical protein